MEEGEKGMACDVDGAGSKREMTRGEREGEGGGEARENRKPLAAQ